MKMKLIRSWNTFWDPARFQGRGKQKGYFEGWYFKLVSPEGNYKLAFIPGISYDPKGKGKAFIQVLDSTAHEAAFIDFDTSEFEPSEGSFDVRLGKNAFSTGRIRIDLDDYSGHLEFAEQVPWKSSWKAPGIMGWYAYMPFMQCYHGLVSMDHRITGHLNIRGQRIDFTGGRGYIEKDWGSSFPRAWIWGQCNHFDSGPGSSLMFSVAHIPWMGSFFIGFLCALYHEGQTIVLATWSGAKRTTRFTPDGVHMTLEDAAHQLEIVAFKAPGKDLVSPVTGSMTGKVNESLDARVEVRFSRNGKLVWDSKGQHAGMEIGGQDPAILATT